MNNDLISRSKLVETIIDPLNVNDAAKNDWYEGYYTAKNEDVEIIKSQPSVDAIVNTIEVRPQGKWINHRNDYGHNIADCSVCGKAMQWHDEDEDGVPRYCWYCGARMENSEE